MTLLLFLLMAYPYQVDTGNTLRLTTNTTRNQGPGLFRYGSAYYSVFRDRVSNVLEVRKSINRGQSWSVVDNANNKPIATETAGSVRAQYATVHDPVGLGNLFWVAWVPPTSAFTNPARFAHFNMATEQWGATVTGGPDIGAGSNVIPDLVLGMRVPLIGQGEPVMFYSGPEEGGFDRLYYVDLPISTGIWGAPTRLNDSAGEAEHYSSMLGCPMGSDGRIHPVVLTTAGDDRVLVRSISRAGAKGSWSTIATQTAGTSFGNLGSPSAFAKSDGSTIGVLFAQGVLALGTAWTIKLATATSAQEPTWSTETVVTGIYEDMGTGSVSGAYIGSGPFVAWQRPTGVGITPKYFYVRKPGGTWGAKTTLHDTGVAGAFSQVVAAYPISGGVGVFFDFGTTPADQPWAPWYWELRTAGKMNSILGASRQPKVA